MADSSNRGFASMDKSRQREIASKGGKAAHEKGTAHEFSADEARNAGRKGGEHVSQNRAHMAAIGRRGGESVSQNREHMSLIGRRGGERVSRDRSHMSEIGREGGQSRGGGHGSSEPTQAQGPVLTEEMRQPAPTEPGGQFASVIG